MCERCVRMMFSVIIPIYNVEKYLPQCIESVLHQTYENFELILVNDGSTDRSGAICDKYAQNDTRIRVVHKKNGGLSDARNAGLSIAKREFIWFLDGDDSMVDGAMSNIAETIMRNDVVDMVTCCHINEYNDGTVELKPLPCDCPSSIIGRDEFLFRLYQCDGSYFAAWKNVYRRSVITANNLRFTKGLIGAEDCEFFMHFVRCGEKFTLLNTPVVNYKTQREGSITNTMSKEAIMGQLKVFSDNAELFGRNSAPIDQSMRAFFARKFANVVSTLYHLKDPKDIEEVTDYVRNHEDILADASGAKYCVAKLVWRLFGYHKGSKVLHTIRSS